MDKRSFVEALAEVALNQVVAGEVSVMKDPPGRRPSLDLVARSEWFLGLSDDDRSMVVDVMRETAYAVLHATLCVFDGAATIVSGPDKGRLTLKHDRGGVTSDLLSDEEPDLHDLLAEQR